MTAGTRSSRGDDELRDEVAVHREAVAQIDDAAGKSPSRRLVATRCASSVRSAATSVLAYVNSAPALDRKPRISSIPR
jgi:hypothetical protein